HQFGEMVWIAPDPNAYENYIYCGAHVGIDMSSDAVPDLITVTGDMAIYYFWDIEPEAIKHIVRWHHDGSVDGIVTERIYPEGFWIDQWMDTPYDTRQQHGFWFEGWFLDKELTIPFTEIEVSANMDIYPKLIPASERTIADVKTISSDVFYPFVSVSGIVTYVSIDRYGNFLSVHLTDGTETLIVSYLYSTDYIPTIGDEILVSGTLYRPFESFGIDVPYLELADYTIMTLGDGTYDYSEAVDIMADFNSGSLVGQKLYSIEGQIIATLNSSGIISYSIMTTDGILFTIHSQSTHFFDGESYLHCLTDYADVTGRLIVYYAWNNNGSHVVFAVPGEFEELDPVGPNPDMISQTILIPWAVIDDFQIDYNGNTALVEPSLNPNLVTVYLEEGTTEFTVTWFQGELSQSITLAVDLTEDAIHSFEYDGTTFWYLLDYASNYGLSLEALLDEEFYINYHNFVPDDTFYSGYSYGDIISTSSWAGDNYILNGVYYDEAMSLPAPTWILVKGDADLYYDWEIVPGANSHQVRWHHDATVDGPYTQQVFAEAYVVREWLDTPYSLRQQHGYWFEGWYLDTEWTLPFTGQELFEDLDLYPKLIPAAERTIADALAADPDLEEQYVSVNGTVSYISMDSTGNIISVLLSDGTGTIVVSGIYNFDYQPTLGDQLLVSGIIVRPFGTYIDCNWINLSAYTLVMPGDGTADYSGAEDIMNDFQNGTLVYSKLYTITGTISSITNPETGITGYYITTSEGQRFTLHSQSTYLFDGLNYIHCAAEYDGMYGVLTVYYAWMDTIVFAVLGQFMEIAQ
ncbi:MAG: OB-fold nucleic acid binding domain-containing protein, partial [Candidatus Izemoplasmatales bacterium]